MSPHHRTIVLVACAKQKRATPAKAKDLYISPLFRKARAWAERFGDSWCILSAKHGLLDPETQVAPYEQTLKSASRKERAEWAGRVRRQLAQALTEQCRVVFLAGVDYREGLLPALRDQGHAVECSLEGLSLGFQLSWLKRELENTNAEGHLERLYTLLDRIRRDPIQGKCLGEYTGRSGLPGRGVYFFFEPGEDRQAPFRGQRVVRVGTHAVSRGSKSKLWTRLRSHRGAQHGGGNHRGSIFRLLAGAALIHRDGKQLDTWGQWSSAPADVREREQWLEKLVSGYIRQMTICWLAIDDKPGPDSARARIERNTIALLSSNGHPQDPPSNKWLGKFSPREAVASSGLWNINHVHDSYDPDFLNEFEGALNYSG